MEMSLKKKEWFVLKVWEAYLTGNKKKMLVLPQQSLIALSSSLSADGALI